MIQPIRLAFVPWRKTLHALSDLLLPFDYQCMHCRMHRSMREGSCFCHACREALDALSLMTLCPRCLKPRASCVCGGSSTYYAAYRYGDIAAELIQHFKYDHVMGIAFALARQSEPLARVAASGMDAFVPVPLYSRKQRERGFNQAEILARKWTRYTSLPVNMLLRRIRDTQSQTHLTRAERAENVRGAFVVSDKDAARGKRLVLVDDVLTTGATVEECARMLLQSGAAEVRVLTVAAAGLAQDGADMIS